MIGSRPGTMNWAPILVPRTLIFVISLYTDNNEGVSAFERSLFSTYFLKIWYGHSYLKCIAWGEFVGQKNQIILNPVLKRFSPNISVSGPQDPRSRLTGKAHFNRVFIKPKSDFLGIFNNGYFTLFYLLGRLQYHIKLNRLKLAQHFH